MSDRALFLRLLQANYGADIADLQLCAGSAIHDVRAVLQVTLADGRRWLLRAYRQDESVPDWLVGCGAETQEAWLESRAATLVYLETQGYPASRVVLTLSGAVIGKAEGWCTLLTSFIEGTVTDASSTLLHGLGATLGQLHARTLAAHATALPPVGQSWWHLDAAVPAALAQYAALAPTLPPEWQPTVAAFCMTLRTIHANQATLPHAVIHADAWVGNAVQTPTGEVVLIDWEPSGYGLAVLDLGRLLLNGHMDLDSPHARPIVPAAWRINAIIDGYCTQRMLTDREQALLLDAIRFGVAFGAATHFSRAHHADWSNPLLESLVRRQHWYAVSEEIAGRAMQRLDEARRDGHGDTMTR